MRLAKIELNVDVVFLSLRADGDTVYVRRYANRRRGVSQHHGTRRQQTGDTSTNRTASNKKSVFDQLKLSTLVYALEIRASNLVG